MAMTLWGRDSSANVQKVRWALGELGLAYEHVPLGGRFGGGTAPSYLAMNPNGLVPTLRDDDLVLWESHAIVRYLSNEYGGEQLAPTAPRRRSVVDQWTDWTATTFQPAWSAVFWSAVRTPVAERQPQIIAAAKAKAERMFAIMDARLGEVPYLGGDSFSYADIVAGIAMYRWTTMDIARDPHANVAAWHRLLRARPAFCPNVEIDYAEMVGVPVSDRVR